MKNTMQCTFVLLSIQILLTVHSAPVKFLKRSKSAAKDGLRRKLTKSRSKLEDAEKKSKLNKKTDVSVNGQVLPLAALSSKDKTIQITLQKAANPFPPVIQEVTPGGQNTGTIGMAPGYQPPGAQGPVTQSQVGLHPGLQTTNTNVSPGIPPPGTQALVGMSPGETAPQFPGQQVGMHPGLSTGTTHLGTQALGMSPGVTVSQVPGQQVGMHPGLIPATSNLGTQALGRPPGVTVLQVPGQQVGMHPGLIPATSNLGTQALGMSPGVTATGALNTNQVTNSGKQLVVQTSSDGHLTYKPLIPVTG